jgi:hypothetical protein
MRRRAVRRGAAIPIALGSLLVSGGCADVPTPATASGQGGSASGNGGSVAGAGQSGSIGIGGIGGAAGIDSNADASAGGGGQSGAAGAGGGGSGGTGADGSAPIIDGASGRDGGAESGVSKCSPACGGATPVCDEASSTCKTCSRTAGCGTDKPLCDTAANGGLGACKAMEVLALYTVYEQNMDLAHRSWVREANAYFPMAAQANSFVYTSMTGWEALRTVTPAVGRVVLFLDDKPKDPALQALFQTYMDNGGAWMGFHFAAYNAMPLDWDWYFNTFLGSGAYNGNTWRPTSAKLKVEDTAHPVAQGLGALLTTAPNEWYAWKVDLRTLPNIKILFSVDPSSFPLGTGPIATEIWRSGYYPVIWTNTNYKMLYVNMGHNDMDYEGGTNRQLSFAFQNMQQNHMLLNAIKWLGGATKTP